MTAGRPPRSDRTRAKALCSAVACSNTPKSDLCACPAVLHINGDLGFVDALKSVGGNPRYAMQWLGPWTDQASIDAHMAACRQRGVLPAWQLFYWGDEICLEALKGTYQPTEYGGKAESVGAYWALVKLLASRIKSAGVQGALVSIEPEWNKLGPHLPKDKGLHSVVDEPSVFDQLFADTAGHFHENVPGTAVVTEPGGWTDLAVLLAKFPKMVASCDMVATQSLNTTFGQTAAIFISSPDRLLAKAKELQSGGKGKPVLVLDCAWSSYAGSYESTKPYAPIPPATPESNLKAGEDLQRAALDRLVTILPDLEAAGVQGLFYRGLKDAKMDTKNYWGYFEWGWGVERFDGSRKPAFDSLMALAAKPPEKTRTEAEYQKVVQQRDLALQDTLTLTRAIDALHARIAAARAALDGL